MRLTLCLNIRSADGFVEKGVVIKIDGRYRDERKERRFKKIELESEGTTK